MSIVDKLACQLLELSKQLAKSSKSFTLTLKTTDIYVICSSQEVDLWPETDERKKSKSEESNHDLQMRKQLLKKKLEYTTISSKPLEETNTYNNT